MNPSKKKVNVFIVSDATGITAERVINAVLVQFKQIQPIFKKFSFVKTKTQIKNILNKAEELDAIVIYSIVSKKLRSWIRPQMRKKGLYRIDLLGPLLVRMERLWNIMPAFRPGLLRGLTEDSLCLAESIDYTLKHDDGQGIETLGEADIIILGISRTSKTPTSFYLSCNHGMKVANIPIIKDVPLPETIFTLKKRKFGFTISPKKVAIIRQKRLLYTGESDYADIEYIREELLYSHKIFRKIKGLQVIDVTNSSIEEVAEKII
jgi:[pyruvate, water dikinase]-phosphate phosphotransferase / [pyruvate, water dikinase] kinase